MKKVVILGSTGSVGRYSLEVISRHRDRFKVIGLAVKGGNLSLLLEQIREFEPEIVAVFERAQARELRRHTKVSVLEGEEGVSEVAGYREADFVLSAIVGFAGLLPTLSAIRAGKSIGIANKESLVVAGEIIMKEAQMRNVKLLPVDSEHSASFQCLEGRNIKDVKRLILTASGGPFVGRQKKELMDVRPEDALKHPRWHMGKKITIDSATLMNKGFEVIEAHHLFGLEPDNIDVLIHPESIIHCIVELNDGISIAQMSIPDMKAPIAYALSYPERLSNVVAPLNLSRLRNLTFMSPDTANFPCLSYAYSALKQGGTAPAILNAANEKAVEAFLQRKIGFNDIPDIIKKTMGSYINNELNGLESIKKAHTWACEKADEVIRSFRDKRIC